MTPAEARLWSRLRNRRLGGHKFIRQGPIGPYFADFICRERRIVVEVDGITHASDQEIAADVERAGVIAQLGYRMLRVTNADVSSNLDGVLRRLLEMLEVSP